MTENCLINCYFSFIKPASTEIGSAAVSSVLTLQQLLLTALCKQQLLWSILPYSSYCGRFYAAAAAAQNSVLLSTLLCSCCCPLSAVAVADVNSLLQQLLWPALRYSSSLQLLSILCYTATAVSTLRYNRCSCCPLSLIQLLLPAR